LSIEFNYIVLDLVGDTVLKISKKRGYMPLTLAQR